MKVEGAAYGVAEADEGRSVSGRDGAQRDGGGAGFAEAAGVWSDGLAEVALEERDGKEAAVRLDLHLPGEPAGRRRIGFHGHSRGRRGSRRAVSGERVFGLWVEQPRRLLGFMPPSRRKEMRSPFLCRKMIDL